MQKLKEYRKDVLFLQNALEDGLHSTKRRLEKRKQLFQLTLKYINCLLSIDNSFIISHNISNIF